MDVSIPLPVLVILGLMVSAALGLGAYGILFGGTREAGLVAVKTARKPVSGSGRLAGEAPFQGRASELRAMDERSVELIVAQHLGWKWANYQPGLPPMLVPPDAPPGSIGHVAPSYVGDPGAAWGLLVLAAEKEPGIKVVIATARDGQSDGSCEIGKTQIVGPLPRAIAEAFILEIEKSQPAPVDTPRWTPQMTVSGTRAMGVMGRRVVEISEADAAQTEQDVEQGARGTSGEASGPSGA